MRRIAFIALVAAAACGEVTEQSAGPADSFYFPTGMAVVRDADGAPGKLVVASSNFDLRYDPDTGGSVIAVDPADPARLAGSVNIRSFSGEVAIADPADCPIRNPELGAIAIVPVRGVGFLYQLRVASDGVLTCDDCERQVGTPRFADPLAVGLACDPAAGIARAYLGYLRSSPGEGWITQIDLTKDPSAEGAVQHKLFGAGEFSGFAYDAGRQRLWATHGVLGTTPALQWVDLGGGCRFDSTEAADPDGRPCAAGVAGGLPAGLEPRELALAPCLSLPAADAASCRGAAARRVYLTAGIYDPALSTTTGGRVGDFGGRLLVADLVDTLAGGIDLQIVEQLEVGSGAGDVVVLSPPRADQRDVVAAVGSASGVLLIHDAATGDTVDFGIDPAAVGTPLIGRDAFGLAVDPDTRATGTARLYVGSFEDDFVTPIDVPVENIRLLEDSPPAFRRITGGTR